MTPVKKSRPAKHKSGFIQGRRLFSGNDESKLVSAGASIAMGLGAASPLKQQKGGEADQRVSCGLPKIEVGPGPYRLILDSASKMVVPHPMAERDRFYTEFNVIEKIGEGEFGIAYKCTCKSDGQLCAVKKQKEKYMGVRDRDLRRQEVAKAFQICSVHEQKHSTHLYPNSKYCVGIVEAWEEQGYLYICSELCERGNLNDYILNQ